MRLEFADLDGHDGAWFRDVDGDLILLDASLDRRARRCALAHELVHAERGIGHGSASAATMQREEAVVRAEVARRLVPPDRLRRMVLARSEVEPVTADLVAEEFDVTAGVAVQALAALRCATYE